MKREISTRLKAGFLLIVFALNTLVGFACSLGVDMGFNTIHHHSEEEKEVSVHVHADGKKHHHNGQTNNASAPVALAAKKHQHHSEAEEQHHDKKDASKKDDCCNDEVAKISQTDKAIAHSIMLVHPVFFTAFISAYYNIDTALYPSQISTSIKYFVRSYHPPIADILIANQRFQI